MYHPDFDGLRLHRAGCPTWEVKDEQADVTVGEVPCLRAERNALFVEGAVVSRVALEDGSYGAATQTGEELGRKGTVISKIASQQDGELQVDVEWPLQRSGNLREHEASGCFVTGDVVSVVKEWPGVSAGHEVEVTAVGGKCRPRVAPGHFLDGPGQEFPLAATLGAGSLTGWTAHDFEKADQRIQNLGQKD